MMLRSESHIWISSKLIDWFPPTSIISFLIFKSIVDCLPIIALSDWNHYSDGANLATFGTNQSITIIGMIQGCSPAQLSLHFILNGRKMCEQYKEWYVNDTIRDRTLTSFKYVKRLSGVLLW